MLLRRRTGRAGVRGPVERRARRRIAAWCLALACIVLLVSGVPAIGMRTSPAHRALLLPLLHYVNPFVGTADGGNTFPGAAAPFGMVQWSPDTLDGSVGGYAYRDYTIKGFSLTHLSGVGCSIYQDIPFLPVPGPVTVSPAAQPSAYTASFLHANEEASPGYYRVRLASDIQVELTATRRTGLGAFTYPAAPTASMLINVGGSANGTSAAAVSIVGPDTVIGFATSGSLCGRPNRYTLYFAAQFSRPFTAFGTWTGSRLSPGSRASVGGQSGAFVSFDTASARDVEVKVGLSFVGVPNALANLHAENPGWDLRTVRAAAGASWNRLLNRIQAQGGTLASEQTFYTALYHVLLHPNVFSDVNGEYIGFDNQVHRARGYTQYANFSSWDTYRTTVPLLALLAPRETSDMMQSLVADGREGGWLPRWPVANGDSGVMVGDSAVPVIAGAYAFGARGFDARAALRAMVKSATHATRCACAADPSSDVGRPDLAPYLALGYVPFDSRTWRSARPAAATLEYATDDFAIARFAAALGDTATSTTFMRRAQNWQNLFNPATGLIQPRLPDGQFLPDFDPTTDYAYAEGNATQYTWMVPYNLRALFTAMGGAQRVVDRLDTFLTQLNAGPFAPYAWLGNEPTLEVPWEYDFAGAPWRTQAVVRQAMAQLYRPTPDGLAGGDDDLGTLSAWYVWAAIGLYPEIPGVGILVLGSPLFPRLTWQLTGGDLTITAPTASATTPYLRSLSLDGHPYTKPWLPLEALVGGADLRATVSATPDTAWGSHPTDAPPSFATGEAPALGSASNAPGASGGGLIVVPAGGTAAFRLSTQNVTDRPLIVRWSAAVPPGLHLDATSGALAVGPEQEASATLRLRVLPSTHALSRASAISIPFRLRATPADGSASPALLPPVVVAIAVR